MSVQREQVLTQSLSSESFGVRALFAGRLLRRVLEVLSAASSLSRPQVEIGSCSAAVGRARRAA